MRCEFSPPPPPPGPCPAVLKPTARKVHVAAILAHRAAETMAEDVVSLKELLHATREREVRGAGKGRGRAAARHTGEGG